jgi:hypothetical protein
MTDEPRRPALTPRAEAERRARAEREAAALRANLQRRKAQLRARQPGGPPADPSGDSPADAMDSSVPEA